MAYFVFKTVFVKLNAVLANRAKIGISGSVGRYRNKEKRNIKTCFVKKPPPVIVAIVTMFRIFRNILLNFWFSGSRDYYHFYSLLKSKTLFSSYSMIFLKIYSFSSPACFLNFSHSSFSVG